MFLSESNLSLYWDRAKGIPPKTKGTIETIVTGPDVPQRIKALLMKRLEPLHFVFESAENGISLLWKWPAYKIPLKANTQMRRCPEPRGGNEQSIPYLTIDQTRKYFRITQGVRPFCPTQG